MQSGLIYSYCLYMNTAIKFLYRDAANNKQWHEVIIAGKLDQDLVRENLWECVYFLPTVLGLPALQVRFSDQGYEYPSPDDHPWHEFVGLSHTPQSPTVQLCADDIINRLKHALYCGWEALSCETDPSLKIALG